MSDLVNSYHEVWIACLYGLWERLPAAIWFTCEAAYRVTRNTQRATLKACTKYIDAVLFNQASVEPTDISFKEAIKFAEGTLSQHRVTKLSPRPASAEDLKQLFLDSMTLW